MKRITMAVGVTATAMVQITDASVYPSASCVAARAAGLRIHPPDQSIAKFVPFPFRACSRSSEIDLHVSTVKTGMLP